MFLDSYISISKDHFLAIFFRCLGKITTLLLLTHALKSVVQDSERCFIHTGHDFLVLMNEFLLSFNT